jgi:hypothetical protein
MKMEAENVSNANSIKGNGNIAVGIKRSLSCSDDEEFKGFDISEHEKIREICSIDLVISA